MSDRTIAAILLILVWSVVVGALRAVALDVDDTGRSFIFYACNMGFVGIGYWWARGD